MTGVELFRTLHAMIRSIAFILSTVGNCRFTCCNKKTPRYRSSNRIGVCFLCNNSVWSWQLSSFSRLSKDLGSFCLGLSPSDKVLPHLCGPSQLNHAHLSPCLLTLERGNEGLVTFFLSVASTYISSHLVAWSFLVAWQVLKYSPQLVGLVPH